jgi:hypothetical protein
MLFRDRRISFLCSNKLTDHFDHEVILFLLEPWIGAQAECLIRDAGGYGSSPENRMASGLSRRSLTYAE